MGVYNGIDIEGDGRDQAVSRISVSSMLRSLDPSVSIASVLEATRARLKQLKQFGAGRKID